jgi:hypothetical protein
MLRAKQEAARDNSAKSLFDFINVRLGGAKKGSWRSLDSKAPAPGTSSDVDLWTPGAGASKNQHQTSKNQHQTSKNKVALNKQSSEKLKIESFKMDERIRGLEKDITRLRDSWHRHR